MRHLKMISAMLLVSFSLVGCNEEELNIDKSIFSVRYQKFYQSNAYTGEKAEFSPQDSRADKLICMPYAQYISFQQNYVCKHK